MFRVCFRLQLGRFSECVWVSERVRVGVCDHLHVVAQLLWKQKSLQAATKSTAGWGVGGEGICWDAGKKNARPTPTRTHSWLWRWSRCCFDPHSPTQMREREREGVADVTRVRILAFPPPPFSFSLFPSLTLSLGLPAKPSRIYRLISSKTFRNQFQKFIPIQIFKTARV